MLKNHIKFIGLFFVLLWVLAFLLYVLNFMLFTTNISSEFTVDKFYAYECGFNSFSDARNSFDIKFYLVAVLFLIFDLEIAFLMPFSIAFVSLKFFEVFVILIFLFILILGFIFEWKKGGLDW